MNPGATQVFWTPQALADLEAIRDFIARGSARYAGMVAADIRAAVRRLRTFPHSGRVVPELGDPYVRELIVGNYRVVYRAREKQADILTVVHGARRFPR